MCSWLGKAQHRKLPNVPKLDYSFNKIPDENVCLFLLGST